MDMEQRGISQHEPTVYAQLYFALCVFDLFQWQTQTETLNFDHEGHKVLEMFLTEMANKDMSISWICVLFLTCFQ